MESNGLEKTENGIQRPFSVYNRLCMRIYSQELQLLQLLSKHGVFCKLNFKGLPKVMMVKLQTLKQEFEISNMKSNESV